MSPFYFTPMRICLVTYTYMLFIIYDVILGPIIQQNLLTLYQNISRLEKKKNVSNYKSFYITNKALLFFFLLYP
jgi:hypothetical protein